MATSILRQTILLAGARCPSFYTTAGLRNVSHRTQLPLACAMFPSTGLVSLSKRLSLSNPLLISTRCQSSVLNGVKFQTPPIDIVDVGFIPEPPPLPDSSAFIDPVARLLEQYPEGSLQGLGIGSYWPPGLVQHALEFFHHTSDIPYWGVIAITTLLLRICLFPVVIRLQKSSAALANIAPQSKEMQEKITAARKRGDQIQTHLHSMEYRELMKSAGVSPLTMVGNFVPQIATFLTFFIALRGMAAANLPGLLTGGIFWFENLTVPDPTWLLPLACSATMFFVLELGVDTGVAASSMKSMKWVMRFIPVITFFFIKGFPTAILVYWTSANVISLCQALILRSSAVRSKLGIPLRVVHPASNLPKKNLLQSWRDLSKSTDVNAAFQERVQLADTAWKAAATGPIVPTFKTNPKAKLNYSGGASDINSRRT